MADDQIVVVHVSDTHFDENLLNRRFGWIPGYRAHDLLLCVGFQHALRDVERTTGVKPNDTCVLVLHSGDLTATGMPGEFSAANLYFRGERPLNFDRAHRMIGLRLRQWQLAVIPGNHDHWAGKTLPPGAHNARILGEEFRSTPWKLQLASLDEKLVLELHAIDSNSGMQRHHRDLVSRIRARGTIAKGEFDQLIKQLAAKPNSGAFSSDSKRVRAIVVHHPFTIPPGLFDAQPLDRASAAQLLRIAHDFRVFAILNGHTHRFFFKRYASGAAHPGSHVWEMRSATTFQGPAAATNQGFLVHQIRREEDDSVWWRVWLYRWNGAEFKRSDEGPWLRLQVEKLLPPNE